MAGYMNQIRKAQAMISTERLIRALGADKYKELMEEVNKKAPGKSKLLDNSHLSVTELATLKKVTAMDNFKSMEKELGAKEHLGDKAYAKLAYRYLRQKLIV